MIKTKEMLDAAPEMLATLKDVLNYRFGNGEYNFSKYPRKERDIRALEAWEALEYRMQVVISEASGEWVKAK